MLCFICFTIYMASSNSMLVVVGAVVVVVVAAPPLSVESKELNWSPLSCNAWMLISCRHFMQTNEMLMKLTDWQGVNTYTHTHTHTYTTHSQRQSQAHTRAFAMPQVEMSKHLSPKMQLLTICIVFWLLLLL